MSADQCVAALAASRQNLDQSHAVADDATKKTSGRDLPGTELKTISVTRRKILASAAIVGTGLAIGFAAPKLRTQAARLRRAPVLGDPGWIEVAADGRVTAFCTLTEMGQGAWSCLAQIVSEELEVAYDRVTISMAPAWRAFDAPVGFHTGESSSARRLFNEMRAIAASARQLMIETAAEIFRVDTDSCRAVDGSVVEIASGRTLTFGSLAQQAANREPASPAQPKAAHEWRVITRSVARRDVHATVQGATDFGLDLALPGMLVACVSQAPVPGSTLASSDRSAALRSPGVIEFLDLGDTIAVVARDHWQAIKGLSAAQVKWQPPAGFRGSMELLSSMREAVTPKAGTETAPGGRSVTALYDAPFLMHAQLEPVSAIASVGRLSAELWIATQVQGAMQSRVAAALGMWAHAVTIHTPRAGGSFGRRLDINTGVTAARIARGFGVPVKALWTREEDSLQTPYRPMSAARLSATLDSSGNLTGFEARIASVGDHPRLGGLRTQPYSLPRVSATYANVPTPIRVGPWRSVDQSQNVFFRESFLDECAEAAGIDPLEFRLRMLSGNARGARVLTSVAELARWDSRHAEDRHLGLAFEDSFGSITAQIVEVARTSDGQLRIAKVYAAIDCGIALNPDNVKSQLEGGILFGMSAALWEAATFGQDGLRYRNYEGYRVLRMSEAPEVSVQILSTPEAGIGGVGEVGVPPIAPAIANALYAAMRVRVRSLPLGLSDLPLYGK